MISTIGEALDQGWKIPVRCAWGKRDAMKSIRECIAFVDLELETLVWTPGQAFPLDSLATRRSGHAAAVDACELLFHPPLGNGAVGEGGIAIMKTKKAKKEVRHTKEGARRGEHGR